MNNVEQLQAFLRKRKMMWVLPILVIPFITLAFWALGGGKMKADESVKDPTGLNLHLPNPKVKDKVLDKLGFYDEADRDSMKRKQEKENDPYYLDKETKSTDDLETIAGNAADKFHQSVKLNTSTSNNTDEAEEKLMAKIAQLKEVVNQPKEIKPAEFTGIDENLKSDSKLNGSVNRLEGMLQSMNQDSDTDPELDKLSGMMDKIIAIQHPETVKDKPAPMENSVVFRVSNQSADDTIVNGFYGLDAPNEMIKSNAIEAVVNDGQVLVSGSTIKLRLVDDAFIKDVKIAPGNFVYGVASLDGERLKVGIKSIRIGNSIYPVKMKVFDLDGLEGIYIPGAINRDLAKQSADNSLQTMQLTSLDPSLAAQATAAGISTAKKLISKNIKLEKVFVKAGYKVLLKN